MMKTKLKTMIGVLRPNTGKGNCVQPKFTLGKMLSFLFVFISFGTGNLHAVVYDFEQWQQYAGATLVVGADYTAIDQGKVITSITSTNDGTLDLLTYGNPRISFNPTYSTEHGSWGWTNRPDKQGYGLRSYNAESYETIFGVCTLWNGDRVKITYSGGGSLHFKDNDVAKVDGTFVTANQVLESGTEFTMTSSRGDILLKSDNNNLVIRKIEVIPQSGSPAISFTEFTSAVNRVDMKVGDERMAYVNVTPSTSTPVFTSSDNTVATVNHYGYVQAVGSGTAIITAALTVGTLAPVYAYYYVSVTTSTTSVYTFDFTGCGTNSYVLQTTNEPTIKRINFLNHRDDYGDKVFETSQDGLTFPLDFFALNLDSKTSGSDVFTSGVFLQDGGIDFKEDCTFYITGLHNGDKVRINYYTYTEDRVSPNSAKTKMLPLLNQLQIILQRQ